MALSPEIRVRKIREIAERHSWTIRKAEEQINSFKARLSSPEEAIIQALLEMRPELLQQPG